MKLLLSIILLSTGTIAAACEDVSMSPKEFYTLAGRNKCYASYDGGCVCRVVDGTRTFPINKSESVFLKGCKCQMFLMCYDNGPCIHQEVCEQCQTEEEIPIPEIP